MNYTITHCINTELLIEEIKEKYPEYEQGGNFLVNKKPHSIRNDNETLNRVCCTDDELIKLQSLDNLTCLGDYEECFADSDKKAIYDRIWEPGKIIDEETGQTKPIEFMRFIDE